MSELTKRIRIGLTERNSVSLMHPFVYIKGQEALSISGFRLDNEQIYRGEPKGVLFSFFVERPFVVQAKSGILSLADLDMRSENKLIGHSLENMRRHVSLLVIKPSSEPGKIIVGADDQFVEKKIYDGELWIIAQGNSIRLVLNSHIEAYVRSVLQAEIPASYHVEAIKAQAVSSRTYAFHPRVAHEKDFCNVCDSYLCCQAFSGWQPNENNVYSQAAGETAGQILTCKDAPILALFSSCAGGHTENYQDCFSDWQTGNFPPAPIPYLIGVSERTPIGVNNQIVDEAALRKLWQNKNSSTVDAWFKRFSWSYHLSSQDLESKMHHTLSKLLQNEKFAPFITSPPSGVFGYIQSFSIAKRGVGGTAITLIVNTSKGPWQFNKELVIRSLFKNKNVNLERLPSAKIFFDHCMDKNKKLRSLFIYGLGSGHGVGLQQTGAEGWARHELDYRKILSHYYNGALLEGA